MLATYRIAHISANNGVQCQPSPLGRRAIQALADRDSTTIAMPWSAGKSWAGILAAERLAPADAPIAHFVPNARHVQMARREWRWRTHRTVIAACAPPAGEDADGVREHGGGRPSYRRGFQSGCVWIGLSIYKTKSRENLDMLLHRHGQSLDPEVPPVVRTLTGG